MVSQGGPVVNRFCKYRVGIIICSAECHGAVHVPAIGRVDSDTSAVITKLIQIVSSRVKHVGCARLSGSPTTLDGETGRASPGSLLYEPATDPRLRKELRIDVGGKPFERTHHQRGRVSDILGSPEHDSDWSTRSRQIRQDRHRAWDSPQNCYTSSRRSWHQSITHEPFRPCRISREPRSANALYPPCNSRAGSTGPAELCGAR